MQKSGSVYILSSPDKTSLYTGVTSNLEQRIWQHKNKYFPESFSAKYNCVVLVYYKHIETIDEAIIEEKHIKAGSRQQKINLISSINPEWKDMEINY